MRWQNNKTRCAPLGCVKTLRQVRLGKRPKTRKGLFFWWTWKYFANIKSNLNDLMRSLQTFSSSFLLWAGVRFPVFSKLRSALNFKNVHRRSVSKSSLKRALKIFIRKLEYSHRNFVWVTAHIHENHHTHKQKTKVL